MKIMNRIYSVVCLMSLLMICGMNSGLEAAEWSHIRTIGENVSFSPDVAVAKNGDAVSVFIHYDGSNQRVQSSIRPFHKHWKTLSQFISPAGFNAENPRVAISPDGNATSVWKIDSGFQFIVQAATLNFDKGTWSSAEDLTVPVDLVADPIIAVDSRGNSLAVWAIFDGIFYHIQSAVLKNSCHRRHGWKRLNDIIVDGAFGLDIAIDPKGNAVLAWEGRVGFKGVIQAATLAKGSKSWLQTADVSPSNQQSEFPKVGVDREGNAILVWDQGISIHHIASAKLAFGSINWINTSDPSDIADRSVFPDLAVDPAGNAVAVWKTFIDPSTTNVEAATLAAGSFTWTPRVILTSSLLITDTEVVVDKQGNAVAIWSATGVLQSSSLPYGGSWSPPIDITPSTIGVGGQRIAMTPCAFAVVAYTAQVFASSQEIVQAVHSKGLFPPSPPSNLEGSTTKSRFLTQTEIVNKLTWDPSLDTCVKQYYIRRNSKLIGKVPAKGPYEFYDEKHNKMKDVYSLTAVKANGTESTALTITLPL